MESWFSFPLGQIFKSKGGDARLDRGAFLLVAGGANRREGKKKGQKMFLLQAVNENKGKESGLERLLRRDGVRGRKR